MNISGLINKLKLPPFLCDLLTYKTLVQLRKYIITGVLSVCAEYLILYTLTRYAGLWYIFSNTTALAASFWLNFLLNRYWSFNARNRPARQLLMYSLLFLFNLCASNTLMYLLTDVLGVYYLYSKAFALCLIVSWNFILYKKVIYK